MDYEGGFEGARGKGRIIDSVQGVEARLFSIKVDSGRKAVKDSRERFHISLP